jgi:hypothetical protein
MRKSPGGWTYGLILEFSFGGLTTKRI